MPEVKGPSAWQEQGQMTEAFLGEKSLVSQDRSRLESKPPEFYNITFEVQTDTHLIKELELTGHARDQTSRAAKVAEKTITKDALPGPGADG